MRWQAIFFDFDGVIVDSVDVKTKAFEQMFRQYGAEVKEAVVSYHLKNSGVSRYEKFKYYYEHLLQVPLTEKKLDELGRQFSELVVQKILDSRFISGAYDTIIKLYNSNIPSFIVSGTPEKEIKTIVDKKNISFFFKEVHGSPRKKWEITADIIKRWNLNKEKCLFIGDALSDYKAAAYNKIYFLGIESKDSKNVFPNGTKVEQSVNIEL